MFQSMQENTCPGDASRRRRAPDVATRPYNRRLCPRATHDDGTAVLPADPRGVPPGGRRSRAPRRARVAALGRRSRARARHEGRRLRHLARRRDLDRTPRARRCRRRDPRRDGSRLASDRPPRSSRTRRRDDDGDRRPRFLAPCDLQAIKASGVTFVSSMLERVIEEQARGDPAKAEAVRASLVALIGDDLANVRPGSKEAARVKEALVAQGAWSQYLEVGIGPDAEIFTKAPAMSAVGHRRRHRHPSEIGMEQSRARDRAGGEQPRQDGRRDARQRRQPARLRGAERAAARQGQGQQRLLRDRAVHPPVRRRLRHRRRAPLRARDARRRRRGLRARRRELDAR